MSAMPDTLISVSNLSKKFSRTIKASLRYGARDAVAELLNQRHGEKLRDQEYWALRDISFELRRGDCLGVLGYNGAGKSTLLKILSGLLRPDKGEVVVYGELGQLIDLSAGFNPSLTGRENVRLRAKLLGLSSKDFNRMLDDIIEFSELDEFIDSPIQFYSSGMKARLAFAVSTAVSPEILLIDETLAVGDLSFRLKCYDRISKLIQNSAVILVTHALNQVTRLCNVGCYLEKGQMKHYGDPQEAIRLYSEGSDRTKRKKPMMRPELITVSYFFDDRVLESDQTIPFGSELAARLETSKLPSETTFRIVLKTHGGYPIADWNSARSSLDRRRGGFLHCDLGRAELCPGTYQLSVMAIDSNNGKIHCMTAPHWFRIEGEYLSSIPIQKMGRWRAGQK